MNRKKNVNYIKPEDPQFLKDLKRQAGYDDKNHKFDTIDRMESDFVDDGEDEQPQVVVLKKGDLTAEQAEQERKNIEQIESETKADLNQKVIFKVKKKSENGSENKRKHEVEVKSKKSKSYKKSNVLSFADEEEDEESS